MKSNKKLWLVGILVFILALLWNAPATLLSQWLANKTQQHVLLSLAEGSVWRGQANVEIANDNAQNRIHLGKFRWQTYPLQLLQGRIYLAVYQNESEPAWLSISSDQVHVEHLDVALPASVIAHFAPHLNVAQLGGQLRIVSDSMIASEQSLQGKVMVDWGAASSPLSVVNPLGNYQAQLEGNEGGLSVNVNTLSGALQLEGNGAWSTQTGLSFNGVATAQTDQQVALAPLLHVLGNEQVAGSGRYAIQVSQ